MAFIRFAPDLTDAAFAAEFRRVSAAAAAADGYAPFNEQSLFDAGAGRRTPFVVEDGHAVVGAGILGGGELDLVVDPARRRLGHGGAALARILADAPGELRSWSHGDHPAARTLADRFGFTAERTLLQLRLGLTGATARAATGSGAPAGPGAPARAGSRADTQIDAFRPGQDDAEWVALNALVFAAHPEQGALTRADLAARRAESWFSAGDFLVARDARTGRMIGYNWLKIEPGSPVGEIYVVGVHPDAAGRGVGRRLMQAGLDRLRSRGCDTADLYVESDSAGAVALYRSLGFTEQTVDVQYRRRPR